MVQAGTLSCHAAWHACCFGVDIVDVEAHPHALETAIVGEPGPEVGLHALLRQRAPARWLKATLPRIIAPAIAIVHVSGSSSSSHAQPTPNNGIR